MLHSGCVKLHQKFRDFVGLPMGLLREESPKNRMNTGLFGSRSGEYGLKVGRVSVVGVLFDFYFFGFVVFAADAVQGHAVVVVNQFFGAFIEARLRIIMISGRFKVAVNNFSGCGIVGFKRIEGIKHSIGFDGGIYRVRIRSERISKACFAGIEGTEDNREIVFDTESAGRSGIQQPNQQ